MVSVNDLKSRIASGVVFAGFDGGLSDRLDWWAGIRYYKSPGWSHCSILERCLDGSVLQEAAESI